VGDKLIVAGSMPIENLLRIPMGEDVFRFGDRLPVAGEDIYKLPARSIWSMGWVEM
jgi:hypothetical protein